jgi:hypothetical protein
MRGADGAKYCRNTPFSPRLNRLIVNTSKYKGCQHLNEKSDGLQNGIDAFYSGPGCHKKLTKPS